MATRRAVVLLSTAIVADELTPLPDFIDHRAHRLAGVRKALLQWTDLHSLFDRRCVTPTQPRLFAAVPLPPPPARLPPRHHIQLRKQHIRQPDAAVHPLRLQAQRLDLPQILVDVPRH